MPSGLPRLSRGQTVPRTAALASLPSVTISFGLYCLSMASSRAKPHTMSAALCAFQSLFAGRFGITLSTRTFLRSKPAAFSALFRIIPALTPAADATNGCCSLSSFAP